jgi:hypothetical protein
MKQICPAICAMNGTCNGHNDAADPCTADAFSAACRQKTKETWACLDEVYAGNRIISQYNEILDHCPSAQGSIKEKIEKAKQKAAAGEIVEQQTLQKVVDNQKAAHDKAIAQERADAQQKAQEKIEQTEQENYTQPLRRYNPPAAPRNPATDAAVASCSKFLTSAKSGCSIAVPRHNAPNIVRQCILMEDLRYDMCEAKAKNESSDEIAEAEAKWKAALDDYKADTDEAEEADDKEDKSLLDESNREMLNSSQQYYPDPPVYQTQTPGYSNYQRPPVMAPAPPRPASPPPPPQVRGGGSSTCRGSCSVGN